MNDLGHPHVKLVMYEVSTTYFTKDISKTPIKDEGTIFCMKQKLPKNHFFQHWFTQAILSSALFYFIVSIS